jgi:hypothetical protein
MVIARGAQLATAADHGVLDWSPRGSAADPADPAEPAFAVAESPRAERRMRRDADEAQGTMPSRRHELAAMSGARA